MNRKIRYAKLSIISNTFLIILKIIVGLLSGSVSIISEAVHSIVDLVAALIAYISVRISDKPPDEEHPYGHDKVENISGVIEALLIFAAAAIIIMEAVKKIIHQEPVESLGYGVLVMFVSSVVNFFVSRMLYKVARQEESVALEADALHLKVDVYTSAGVGLGLLFIWITGWTIFDPIIAILIALFILKESWEMLMRAFSPLIDFRISKNEIEIIKSAIDNHKDICIDIHEIRTRRSGKTRHIDFHLMVPDDITVKEAHAICDDLEKDIASKIGHTHVLIHIESCGLSRADMAEFGTKKNTHSAKGTKKGQNKTNEKRTGKKRR